MAKNSYEDYLEWEKKKGSKWALISKNIKPAHVLIVLGLLALGNYMVSTGKLQSSLFIGLGAAVVVAFIFLIIRKDSAPQLIPEHVIKQIAQEALEKKRQQGLEIPFDSNVRVNLQGESIYEQDMVSGTSGVIKREVGFEMRRKGYIKKGVIGIHPYTGTVLGIRWEKFGYSGKESKDRQIVPVNVINKPQQPQGNP